MTKKKIKNDKKVYDEVNMDIAPLDSIRIGTPPAVLFPARNFKFKVVNDNVTISIKRGGSYFELAPEVFTEEDGSFNIFDEESKILYLPSITKVLFAEHKYPNMEANQLFVIIALKLKDDIVDVIGQIIEILHE